MKVLGSGDGIKTRVPCVACKIISMLNRSRRGKNEKDRSTMCSTTWFSLGQILVLKAFCVSLGGLVFEAFYLRSLLSLSFLLF